MPKITLEETATTGIFTPDPNHAEQTYNEYIMGYTKLTREDKAVERLANGILYQKYQLAQKYGIQLYNYLENGGRYQPYESGS